MSDHEIPNDPPTDITHIKRLQIYLTSEDTGTLEDLGFHIYGFEEKDRTDCGKEVGDDDIDNLIEGFVAAPSSVPEPLTREATQLDFPVQRPCCIVLKLIGEFWEFSKKGPEGHAVRTKKKLGKRYRRLERHYDTAGKIRAVSFYVQEVKHKNDNVKDGINLYVDFVEGKYRLPVMIDPDIENKGDKPTK